MKKTYTKQELNTFLDESNKIEGVYDNQSFNDALEAWNYLVKQEHLTLDVIRETHRILMQNQPLAFHERGFFRKVPVYIGGREGLVWQMVEPDLLMQFCFETARAYPAPDALKLHVVYEKIHPFVDGNGRTGRMFMNWTRVKNGEPVIIFTEAERQEYYKLFQ